MTPPANARDAMEGWCETCCDWLLWSALHPCGDCHGTYCLDHHGEHECDGAA